MFIFFLVDGSTVITFVGSLLLFAVVYTWIVWLRVGRYTENWSVVRPFVTYIKAQDHVCMLVSGSVLIKTVLFFIKISPSKANISSNIVNCVSLKPCIKL